MNISSGWSKGLKILTPEGLETRPTRERVRQSALNMLQPWMSESRIVDLFAGSGSVGIELVSRGGKGAIFVENSPSALKALSINTKSAEERAIKQGLQLNPWRIEASDVGKFLATTSKETFDLVWADPPYHLIPEFLEGNSKLIPHILSSGGVFALESGSDSTAFIEEWEKTFAMKAIKRRAYGVSTISIWQKD